jgi:hypothetical protein
MFRAAASHDSWKLSFVPSRFSAPSGGSMSTIETILVVAAVYALVFIAHQVTGRAAGRSSPDEV